MATVPMVQFDTPACYEISLTGILHDDILKVIHVSNHKVTRYPDKTVTSINTCVKDQAQLASILTILYNNRNAILNVACVTNEIKDND
jgi:hypothetical protein